MIMVHGSNRNELKNIFIFFCFCQKASQKGGGGNNSVWTWLVSLSLHWLKRNQLNIFLMISSLSQRYEGKIYTFFLEIFGYFWEKKLIFFLQKVQYNVKEKSYRRPLIPLNPILPPLLLLYRYLSNCRSRSWKWYFRKRFE